MGPSTRSSQTHTSVVDDASGSSTPVHRRPNVVEFPRRPPPAPLSIHASRSVDGDVTMADYDQTDAEAEAGPSLSQRIQAHDNPSHATSSPNVMRVAHDAPRHVPPLVPHETQESKEQRRQKAWGRNLYGNAHVSGIRVPAPEGGVGMWFLFTVGFVSDVVVLSADLFQGPFCSA